MRASSGSTRLAALALVIAVASPAIAQPTPPPPASPAAELAPAKAAPVPAPPSAGFAPRQSMPAPAPVPPKPQPADDARVDRRYIAAPAKPDPFDVPFDKYTLKNGLEVILHRDPSLPLVAVNVWYHVGPTNEPPKRSGFAHLFEHLMFEGSKHVGHEFDLLLESVGATGVNGTTSWDRTNYFETLPRQELELALWLESDRMGFLLDLITQERLDIQRDVVKNERRQTYENSPYGKSELAMYEALFPQEHPYHGAVIGSMEDLTKATLADVKDFYHAFYAPSNATLALAGDFDVATTKQWIEKYFSGLPKVDRPVTPKHDTPKLGAEVRRDVTESVQLSRVAVGWLTPPAYTEDDSILDVVAALLAGGKATRLYQELVVKQKVASDVTASLDSNYLTSMFGVDAMVAAGVDPKKVEKALTDSLKKLGEQGPTPAELDRAKRRLRLHVLNDLQRLDGGGGESGRAGTLQRLNHYLGDPGQLRVQVARLNTVTAADVKRVVTAHLGANRVVVTTRPETQGATP